MEWWSGGALECRSDEVVECWSAGVLEYWSTGVVECWSDGVPEYWSGGVFKYWRDGVIHKIGSRAKSPYFRACFDLINCLFGTLDWALSH